MAGNDVTVRLVTEVPWTDVLAVFGSRGDPARCWCQYFKVSNAEWNTDPAEKRRSMLHDQVTRDAATPTGVIAYVDGDPVGWSAVEPRPRYSRLATTRVVAAGSDEAPDDASVWAVTCFVVRVGLRRRGVSNALLAGAVDLARSHGARVIEGYPVDPTATKASSADLYHGALSVFERAGFEVVSRPFPGRAVVRLGGT